MCRVAGSCKFCGFEIICLDNSKLLVFIDKPFLYIRNPGGVHVYTVVKLFIEELVMGC